MRGPRIHIKDDRDSSIGRGCHLYAGHFRPEISRIFWAAAITAEPSWSDITFSEGNRPKIRAGRDLHPEGRALDISLNHLDGDTDARRRRGLEWCTRMKKILGPDYQFEVHGEGRNLHIHVELDP